MSLSQRQLDALQHIADHCRKTAELVERLGTREPLEQNREARYALIRCVEIIGEAATRLGPPFHAEHAEVPWRLVVGMRNRLVHGYEEVNATTLWRTATQNLPELLRWIETTPA